MTERILIFVCGIVRVRVVVALIAATALIGCGDEADSTSAEDVQAAIEASCGEGIQDVVPVANDSHGKTSGYLVVCKDGDVVAVKD